MRTIRERARPAAVLTTTIAAALTAALIALPSPGSATAPIEDPGLVCPTLDDPVLGGLVPPVDETPWFSPIEGGVTITGSTGRFSSLAHAECSYSLPVIGASDSPFGGFASLEVHWATPNSLERDRRRACLMEESFRNGVGVVRDEVGAYAVYAIDSPVPFDPVAFDRAARQLLDQVAAGALDCDGVEAPDPAPLPPLLAEAFAPLADPIPTPPAATEPDPAPADPAPADPAPADPTPADRTPDTLPSDTPPDDPVPVDPAPIDDRETTAAIPVADPGTPATTRGTPWHRWPLRIAGIAAMIGSLLLLTRTFLRVRREAPVHPLLDIGAVAVTLTVAVVMLALFPITADARWIAAALALGAVLGWWQGTHLVVRRTARGWAARRTGWAIVAFAAGTVIAQVAGYLDRAGIIALGIALSFLSAALTAGLIAGRHPKLGEAHAATTGGRAGTAGTAAIAILTLGLAGAHLAALDQAAAHADGARTSGPEPVDPALDTLIDLVDWSETMIVGGLFSEFDKPPVLVPAPRAFGEPPEPVRSTEEWTATYRGEERTHRVDETYTFALRSDGGCCSILYSGTGTVESEFIGAEEHIAEGRLHDVQIAAVEGFVSEPFSGLPSQGLIPFGEVRSLVRWIPGEEPVPPLSQPETCGRVVGEARPQHERERSDGQGGFDTYLVNGAPAEPRRHDLDSLLVIPCEVPGFTVEAALTTAPPPPPSDDPSRNGGCPVRQEVIGRLAPANHLPGEVTRTTGELFLDPNAPACSDFVAFGQGGSGGARHELSLQFTRPTDEGWRMYGGGTDELLWADLPLPGELPEDEEQRCAIGPDGLPVEPDDTEIGCTGTIRHQIGEVRIHIWTDWQTWDGPNVLVFVTAPWGSYSYRCHYCVPTDPGVLGFIAAVNQMAVDAGHQIAITATSDLDTPSEPVTDPATPTDDATTDETVTDPAADPATADPDEAETTTTTTDDGLEAAPLAALAALAGSAALHALSRGGRRDGDLDDDLLQEPSRWEPPPRRDVPSWVTDPRPLSEIWAEEAAAEASRHGGDLRWDPERNALTTPERREADRLEHLQREGRDRWHQITSAIGPSGMTDLVDYLDHAEAHVVRADGEIDLEALARVEAAVERLGHLHLGYLQAEDYTYRDAAWDTLGEGARHPVVRIGAGLLLGPGADPVLQTLAMIAGTDQMIREGATEREILDALTDELVLYGGLSIAAMAGGQLVQANAAEIRRAVGEAARAGTELADHLLAQLPEDIARALATAGRDSIQFLDQLNRFGNTDVTDAWRRGLGNTWNHAGHTSRLAQLTATDPRLGRSVSELYDQIDQLGPSRTLSPSHRPLNPVEQRALDLLRRDPAGYQEAVRQGLVPPEVHRTVNWARDRVVHDAISQTVQDLGPRSGLTQIDITGTGANPLSVRATRGWTDVDLTAVGDPAATERFRQQFQQNLDAAFGRPGAAQALDVTCFAGRSGSTSGFTDPALRNWLPVEANYSGQSVRVTDTGRAIHGYRPSAAANQPIPRLPTGGGTNVTARADVQRLITAHNRTRPPTSVLDDLRYNGKYAQRIWKLEQVGIGTPTPEGIRVLEQIKADRSWVPSAEELQAAAETYATFTGLIAGRTP